ncbi:GNAT family N-acetyltransferase [Amorphus suaedae]
MCDPTIRPLDPGDADHLARIFFCAVHEGTRDHYSFAQRMAWAGPTVDLDAWRHRVGGLTGFVAERDGEPIGFMTIDAEGYVDLAFVLPSAAGSGVGWRLHEAVEAKARALGAQEMTTQASKAARPFFERQGWSLIAEQSVERRGVRLTNYRMRKAL